MSEMTNARIEAQSRAMRALGDQQRRDLIAGSGNVVGFGRFRTVADRRGFAPAYPVQIAPEPA